MTTRQDTTQPPAGAANPSRVHIVEGIISNLLRIGVGTSLAVVVLGTILTFVHHEDYLSMSSELDSLTKTGAVFPNTLTGVLHGAAAFQGRSIVLVGLLLLIATPVMRVAVSIITFIYQRDPLFVVFTSIVLILLLVSFALGRAGG